MATMASRATTMFEMGLRQLLAAVPTVASVKRLASLAYATDDMTSDEKIGSAFHLGRRSAISIADEMGRPNRNPRIVAIRRWPSVLGAWASSLASRTPGAR